MLKIVDYYFTPSSPYAYLGHQRFVDLIFTSESAMNVKPVDMGKVFSVSGGLPLAKRAPQRQAYRMTELRRWRAFLGIKMNLEPKYFPVDSNLASQMIIAASEDKSGVVPGLTFDVMKAVWAEDRNIADPAELKAIAKGKGLDGDTLLERAQAPETRATYDTLTQEAIDRQVFGAPTYVFNDELFWGQDRLDFLQRALTSK